MTLHTYTLQTQCPYRESTSYTLRFVRYSSDKIFKFQVTSARSNQGHTKMLQTYTPQPMSLPNMNFQHLTLSEIEPREPFSPLAHPDTIGESHIPPALKGTRVKTSDSDFDPDTVIFLH